MNLSLWASLKSFHVFQRKLNGSVFDSLPGQSLRKKGLSQKAFLICPGEIVSFFKEQYSVEVKSSYSGARVPVFVSRLLDLTLVRLLNLPVPQFPNLQSNNDDDDDDVTCKFVVRIRGTYVHRLGQCVHICSLNFPC